MQRTPHSLSSLRTRRMLGMETFALSPTDTSAMRPSRPMYTEISRPRIPVSWLSSATISRETNSSCP